MDEKTLRKLKLMRDELTDIIARAEADSTNGAPDTEWRRWFRRMGAVLNDVERAGGTVSRDEWRAIGLRHNYDPRGLAGFYTGNDPSMVRDPATDERRLTDRGRLEAANWRRLFGGQ